MTTVVQLRPEIGPRVHRIAWIDVIRGVTLLGILLINMQDYSAPPTAHAVTGLDQAAAWLLRFAGEGKFRAMFQFLFGLGFAMLLLRAEGRGESLVPRYLRRLAVLFVLGLAHYVLLWEGDWLMYYALVGVALLLFARSSPKTLLVSAGVLAGLTFVVFGAIILAVSPVTPSSVDPEQAAKYVAYAGGSYAAVLAQRVPTLPVIIPRTITGGPLMLAMFLLGLYAGRTGISAAPQAHAARLRRVFLASGLAGIALSLEFAFTGGASGQHSAAARALALVAQVAGGPVLALAYLSGLALWLQSPVWLARLKPLAAAGRMTLTNYLMQSLVCTTLFYGYGLGWYNKMGTAAGIALALVIFAIQVVFSNLWFRRYQYGPVEWLWRSLTYARAQPMRKPVLVEGA